LGVAIDLDPEERNLLRETVKIRFTDLNKKND
jgi:hypothetical protein